MDDRRVNHALKTLPEFFDAVESGAKTFEVRKDDRGFAVGDLLILERWSPERGYIDENGMARYAVRRITYKLDGGQFGIEKGWCVLGLGDARE
jgi:hypothetical protein